MTETPKAQAAPFIKAIPTRWKGWYFRSRTEARWAVFFDVMDLEFEYEPESFELSNGQIYPIDFWLNKPRWFAEVKPDYLTGEEEFKTREIAGGIAVNVLWLVGLPDFKAYRAASVWGDQYTVSEYSLDIYSFPKLWKEAKPRFYSDLGYHTKAESQFSKRYRDAVYAAREERFF